jgi:hypothetical protein
MRQHASFIVHGAKSLLLHIATKARVLSLHDKGNIRRRQVMSDVTIDYPADAENQILVLPFKIPK